MAKRSRPRAQRLGQYAARPRTTSFSTVTNTTEEVPDYFPPSVCRRFSHRRLLFVRSRAVTGLRQFHRSRWGTRLRALSRALPTTTTPTTHVAMALGSRWEALAEMWHKTHSRQLACEKTVVLTVSFAKQYPRGRTHGATRVSDLTEQRQGRPTSTERSDRRHCLGRFPLHPNRRPTRSSAITDGEVFRRVTSHDVRHGVLTRIRFRALGNRHMTHPVHLRTTRPGPRRLGPSSVVVPVEPFRPRSSRSSRTGSVRSVRDAPSRE